MDNYRSGNWNDSGDRAARSLVTLEKMYKEDNKYSGQKEAGQNDNFDHKLGIFEEMCFKANVPESAKNLAYSTMLRGPALDHYFTNIRKRARTTPFEELCTVTKNYFEGPEYVRGIVTQWNRTTLEDIMSRSENTGKTIGEYLQLLLTELRHLRQGLPPELRTDGVLYIKIVQACQDLPACGYACYKPSETLPGLIEDLISSISTWKKQRKRATEILFTDRRYHRQPPPSSPSKYTSFRRPLSQETPYRRTTFRRNPSRQTGGKKRCFVCRNEDCWSLNHTKEEQEESKKRYRTRVL